MLLHSNFEDFTVVDAASVGRATVDNCREQLQERARFKARVVWEATGHPAIAESFCVYLDESGNKPPSEILFDPDAEEVGALIERSRTSSSKERPVVYRASAALCRASAEGGASDAIEEAAFFLYGVGEMRMPITFATSEHSTVALTVAHDELFVKVSERLRLPFVGTMGAFEEFYEQQLLKSYGKLRKKTAGGASEDRFISYRSRRHPVNSDPQPALQFRADIKKNSKKFDKLTNLQQSSAHY